MILIYQYKHAPTDSALIFFFLFASFIACASMFPRFASDYGLVVANGTYAITAGRCVQCSCGPGNLKLLIFSTILIVFSFYYFGLLCGNDQIFTDILLLVISIEVI
jgi:hypothetical protein